MTTLHRSAPQPNPVSTVKSDDQTHRAPRIMYGKIRPDFNRAGQYASQAVWIRGPGVSRVTWWDELLGMVETVEHNMHGKG